MIEQETCKEIVRERSRGFHSWVCGRKVKEEGLCGIHLAAKRRRATNAQQREAERMAEKEVLNEVKAFIVNNPYVTMRQHYDSISGKYTRAVVVSLDEMKNILEVAGPYL